MIKKILIIEDEEVLLDVLSQKLKGYGFEVITALDGDQGINRIKDDKPDLILLDMVMPKMNGYDVLETMKRENIRIPVVVISNSGQPVDVEKAMSLGACDYIVKAELDPDEIVAKINKCLGNVNLLGGQLETGAGGDETARPVTAEPERRKKVLVLIAEDDMFLRELCAKKLEKAGYDVLVATDGIQAFEKIMQSKPDLVLLDVIMPGMEGFEVLKKVRAHEDRVIADVPVIILSNLGQEGDVKKGMDLGANEYMVKANFTMDEIVKRIEKYLH